MNDLAGGENADKKLVIAGGSSDTDVFAEELIIVNGLLTFIGLLIVSKARKKEEIQPVNG